jgi:hypothetical protein
MWPFDPISESTIASVWYPIDFVEELIGGDPPQLGQANCYFRWDITGNAYEFLSEEQSANLDVLRDITPGTVGQATLAAALSSEAWSALGTTPDTSLPPQLRQYVQNAPDANTGIATLNGLCYLQPGDVNGPSSGWWLIDTVAFTAGSTHLRQTAWNLATAADPTNSRTHQREYHEGAGWTAWVRVRRTETEMNGKYCQFFIQANDPGAVGAGAIWIIP